MDNPEGHKERIHTADVEIPAHERSYGIARGLRTQPPNADYWSSGAIRRAVQSEAMMGLRLAQGMEQAAGSLSALFADLLLALCALLLLFSSPISINTVSAFFL
jgi:hypothetical protein